MAFSNGSGIGLAQSLFGTSSVGAGAGADRDLDLNRDRDLNDLAGGEEDLDDFISRAMEDDGVLRGVVGRLQGLLEEGVTQIMRGTFRLVALHNAQRWGSGRGRDPDPPGGQTSSLVVESGEGQGRGQHVTLATTLGTNANTNGGDGGSLEESLFMGVPSSTTMANIGSPAPRDRAHDRDRGRDLGQVRGQGQHNDSQIQMEDGRRVEEVEPPRSKKRTESAVTVTKKARGRPPKNRAATPTATPTKADEGKKTAAVGKTATPTATPTKADGGKKTAGGRPPKKRAASSTATPTVTPTATPTKADGGKKTAVGGKRKKPMKKTTTGLATKKKKVPVEPVVTATAPATAPVTAPSALKDCYVKMTRLTPEEVQGDRDPVTPPRDPRGSGDDAEDEEDLFAE